MGSTAKCLRLSTSSTTKSVSSKSSRLYCCADFSLCVRKICAHLKRIHLFDSVARWPSHGSCAGLEIKPWKVLEFQTTEKVLELFWKKRGRSWKVWNLFILKVSTRLDDLVNVRTSCHSCCKAGRRTAETVLVINVARKPQIGVSFFSSTSRVVCYRMIDWKKGLEMASNYWMKRPWKALQFLGLLVQEPCQAVRTLDFQSTGCRFESCPSLLSSVTLGKLLTHMCRCHQAV